MLSIQSLTDLVNQFFDKFYFVRQLDVDRFYRSRFIPMIVKHIRLHYGGLDMQEARQALENGISGICDDKYNRSKNFDLPTVNRWFKEYFDGEHLSKIKKNYNRYAPYKAPSKNDRDTGIIARWFMSWRPQTKTKNEAIYLQQDKDFITKLDTWQRNKLREWMQQYRPEHDLTKWIAQ